MPITTATRRKSPTKSPTPRKKSPSPRKNSPKLNNVRKPLMTNRKSSTSNNVLRWRDISVRTVSPSIREEFMKLREGKMEYDSFSLSMMNYIWKILSGNIPEEIQGMNGYITVPENLSNTNMKNMPSLLSVIDPKVVKYTVERDSTKVHWYDIAIVYFPVASTITLFDYNVCCGGKKKAIMKFPVKAGEVVILDSKRYQTPAAKSVAILAKFF